MNNLLIIISEAIEIIEQNFHCKRGDTFPLELTFQDADGEPVPITDWEILFTGKLSKDLDDSAEGVLKETFTPVEDETNKARMELLPSVTKECLGVYFIDVRYKDNNGMVNTVLNGKLIFTKEIGSRINE